MNLFDMTGKVCMVSGAASGMGKAMAMAFADAGSDVMLVDKNTAGVQVTADAIASLGRKAVPVTCDVSDTKLRDWRFSWHPMLPHGLRARSSRWMVATSQ